MTAYVCGQCGKDFSSNCDPVECPECEAIRCPCCLKVVQPMSAWTADTIANAPMILIGWVWFILQMTVVARNLCGLVADRRRRGDRDLADAFEACGVGYRVGSPPSHAAGRTA